MDKEKKKAPKVGSFQNLPKGKFQTVDQGTATIHPGEYVGHQKDMPDNSKILQEIRDAIFGQKLQVNVQSHHGTKYV